MTKINKKSKNPVVIALYALSILVGIYTIFTVYNSYTYISSLVEQGLVISDELANIIVYYVDASLPYLFYAIVIWSIGYIINKLSFISYELKRNSSEDLEGKIIIESSEYISENTNDESVSEEDKNKEI